MLFSTFYTPTPYRTIKLIGGELISSTYLDSVGAEIEELLAESGHASLDALSRRFNLATDTITEVASTRVQGACLFYLYFSCASFELPLRSGFF